MTCQGYIAPFFASWKNFAGYNIIQTTAESRLPLNRRRSGANPRRNPICEFSFVALEVLPRWLQHLPHIIRIPSLTLSPCLRVCTVPTGPGMSGAFSKDASSGPIKRSSTRLRPIVN